MRKVHSATSDALHDQLGASTTGSASSFKKRTAPRNKFLAANADAPMLAGSTEFIPAAPHNQAGLVPEIPMIIPTEHDTWTRANNTDDVVDWKCTASGSFERVACIEQKNDGISERGTVAPPILKLYDQLGGFIKR
jgi:hypothetical protein